MIFLLNSFFLKSFDNKIDLAQLCTLVLQRIQCPQGTLRAPHSIVLVGFQQCMGALNAMSVTQLTVKCYHHHDDDDDDDNARSYCSQGVHNLWRKHSSKQMIIVQ